MIITLAAAIAGCSSQATTEHVVYTNPLDSADAVLSATGSSVDATTSHDGKGSIRIDAAGPTTIRLAEVEPQDAENVTLIYRGHLRTENLAGQAYLEMWCSIPGMGEFFSRALHAPLSGTTGWVSQETPFFLKPGQRAQRVKLNLVVAGTGTVWIDDISLAIGTR
jgi:hypothetical protein